MAARRLYYAWLQCLYLAYTSADLPHIRNRQVFLMQWKELLFYPVMTQVTNFRQGNCEVTRVFPRA